MYKVDADNNKFSGVVYKVVFLGLLSPVYCEFIGYLFNDKNTLTTSQLIIKFERSIIFIAIITILLGVFIESMKIFIYEICDTKYYNKKQLSLLLEQIYLEMS